MSSNLDPRAERVVSPDRDSTLALIMSMADLTWRMFTPSIVLVPLGIFTDLKFHTKPWVTVVSAIVGLGCSVLLVKRQLRSNQ